MGPWPLAPRGRRRISPKSACGGIAAEGCCTERRTSVDERTRVLVLALCFGLVQTAQAADSPSDRVFREKVEPVLKAQCYGCHSQQAEKLQAGLKLDSKSALLKGGDSGPAVVAGKPDESPLIQAIRHEAGLQMPPKGPKLSQETIDDFVQWVTLLSLDPREASSPDLRARQTGQQHWSFQRVRKPAVPPNAAPAWPQNPVDAFVLAKLEERRWHPAPAASRTELIRRVTFDLTGLPPAPDEINAFVNDRSPDAYERLVDGLLGSPRFGERWAQHWLDVVRYAETEGYEYDRHIPDAWRYRDYVIDSLNRDKPFDRFVVEQLAGDEIAPDDQECLTASIFHRLGPVRRNAGNPEIALSRNEVLTERTDIIGSVFLGLSLGCARCHNHKFDPITQQDYYRLQAYFAATDEHNVVLAPEDEQRAWEAATQTIKAEIERLKSRAKSATGPEKIRLTEEIDALEDQSPQPLATIPATRNDPSQRTVIHVLRRGVWENKGATVGPRPLSLLVAAETPELPADSPHPRTQLARWLTHADHPLTARVIVNRLWQQHFGAGLVKTPNDFGVKGERPSHPELLDWLAAELVENGWRLKPIHRLIVLSSTYRQSSRSPNGREYERDDPENRLLWRFDRRRLSAEEVRDAMLAVSGSLNGRAGGASVIIPVEPELVRLLYKPSQWSVASDASEHHRRSIYLIAKRNLRLPFFESLDAPTLLTSCARRESTTHAPQALELLNGEFSNRMAVEFARRLEAESNGNREQIVNLAFRSALGRPPEPRERRLALEFLGEQSLDEFALAMFNLNGFLYVP